METVAVLAIIAFFTLAFVYIWEDITTLAEREHEGAGIPKRAAVVVCDSPTGRAPHTAVARHSSRSANVLTDRGREPRAGEKAASWHDVTGDRPSRSPSLATIGAGRSSSQQTAAVHGQTGADTPPRLYDWQDETA